MAPLVAEEFLLCPPPLHGTILFLGATDTGKTSLVWLLAKRLIQEGRTVSILDLDLGQQSLGVPATIAIRTFSSADEISDPSFDRMMFVGTLSPISKRECILKGAERLLSYASSDVVLVDTTGWIQGEEAKTFKLTKIKTLNCNLVIAIEREAELEHILGEIKETEVVRLSPSRLVRRRDRVERQQYRRRRLASYFRERPLADYCLNLKGIRVKPETSAFNVEYGRVIGLNSEITLSLGILESMDRENIFFRSPMPLEALKEVREIVIGEVGLVFEGSPL